VPKDLTDVNQFETVAVPVGTDSATASSVETPLQTLADRTRFLLFRLMLNFFADCDLTSVTKTANIYSACYDASTGIFTAGDYDGYTRYSTGGLIWDDEGGGTPTGPNPGTANPVYDMDSDDNGRRIACADSGAGDEVFYSTALGTWTACTITGTPGLTFHTVASDKGVTGVWLIADTATPSAVYRSTDGITFSSVTVTGLTTQIVSILHTGDAANNVWVMLTSTQVAYSTDDGATWTVTTHGLSAAPSTGSLAYDPDTGRFVTLIAGTSNVAYSDDGGATWNELSSVLPAAGGGGTARRLVAGNNGRLLAKTGSSSEHCASGDGGATWEQVFLPASAGLYREIVHGDGLFLSVGPTDAQRSLR